VSSKIGVLESLIDKCDKVAIGGGMNLHLLQGARLAVGKKPG